MQRRIGTNFLRDHACEFRVWAPLKEKLSLHLVSGDRVLPLEKDQEGYFSVIADHVKPGDKYFYVVNEGQEYPDPASYYQPEGVLGPSCVVDHRSFSWNDKEWKGIALNKMIFYELHVGTFTPQGTFDGVISKLPYLKELGINAIEIMPVAQFSGERNWGYDGVYPFAVQHSYGGPDGLKRLVEACHAQGMSVVLDVVYNHLGPEGNFLGQYMPCFTDKYVTPWGKAINFDDAYSFGVREYFIQNALYWFEHFHIDALRLDAVHGIFDMGATHILKELSQRVVEFSQESARAHYLIAESDLNDVRILEPYEQGGYGIDAQWNDDFHHCLHALLTREDKGYYQDFGGIAQMAKAINQGFVYSGEFSSFRKRNHGSPSGHLFADRFVGFCQNHDQVGNRMKGERLSQLTCFEALKIAAGTVLLSPARPMLFMGEEYGEEAPFLYFMHFQDEKLIQAVREGRKKEFAFFQSSAEPEDPYSQDTFLKSKLQWEKINIEKHRILWEFYKKLIQMRKRIDSQLQENVFDVHVDEQAGTIVMLRQALNKGICVILNFSGQEALYQPADIQGQWQRILSSSDKQWMGPGTKAPEAIFRSSQCVLTPLSFIVFERMP